MEILNSSISVRPRISPAVGFSASGLAISFPSKISFPIYLVCSIPSRKYRISAHLGRPRTRPNNLRKKLAHQFQHGSSQENSVSSSEGFISDERSQNSSERGFNNESQTSVPDDDVKDIRKESGKKKAGESALWSKLESWVDQYKKDTEFWGIGTGSIFTVYQGSDSKIERVVVNEDEIRRRNSGTEDLDEVSFKISLAHDMAREMENNIDVIPKNSSVAKFMVSGVEPQSKSRFFEVIQGISSRPDLFRKMSVVGVMVLCGLFVVQATRILFTQGKSSNELTKLEKEMLRRKQRSRTERENMVRGSVEVMPDPIEPKSMPFRRPLLDKEELANNIINSRASAALVEPPAQKDGSLKDKIEEIRMMARLARKLENGDALPGGSDVEDNKALKDASVNSVSSENKLVNAVQSKKKLRIIKSAEEARDYLSKKPRKHKVQKEHEASSHYEPNDVSSVDIASRSSIEAPADEMHASMPFSVKPGSFHRSGDQTVGEAAEGSLDTLDARKKPRKISSSEAGVHNKDSELSNREREEDGRTDLSNQFYVKESSAIENRLGSHDVEDVTKKNDKAGGIKVPETGASAHDNSRDWIEKNFHEFEPVIRKIGVGFSENYQIAKEKSSLDLPLETEKSELQHDGVSYYELEWMNDENLRDIVFQVRDNELSGRDPFHLMTEDQKRAFFSGLDKKVEAENMKLRHLHEYLHSNIENLDYGADGISIYDPPEKIIPRWKVPPAERNPEFLNSLMDQRENPSTESLEKSVISEKTGVDIPKKAATPSVPKVSRKSSSKTVIQGSDGSVRAGKKSGKEYWQHTKKWSQGFMESYNAESDPEVKSVMKDIGKDLDRWITEKEIKEAAELIDKLPEKGRDFLKQKLDKVKREMELFGPQAVVSKYREYAEDKKEDYLWWLDLPYILCIEMYTVEDGEQKVGLYSLEMGADLELDPKQYHVIAFEDAGDCKSLCYIVQAHMEMLGNGHAFVIAQSPKDAFREAKANGFSVTVVRKGQVQLNVDQTLEEVEESLVEIGSKIYHDKITKERSVDVNALMKGVFGFNLPAQGRRKRLQRKLRRRIKQ